MGSQGSRQGWKREDESKGTPLALASLQSSGSMYVDLTLGGDLEADGSALLMAVESPVVQEGEAVVPSSDVPSRL